MAGSRPGAGRSEHMSSVNLPQNSAQLEVEFAREFECFAARVFVSAVNHAQVENCESDQREDSGGESSGRCGSDFGSAISAAEVAVNFGCCGDSRKSPEKTLRPQKFGCAPPLSRPLCRRHAGACFGPSSDSASANSKVIDSCAEDRAGMRLDGSDAGFRDLNCCDADDRRQRRSRRSSAGPVPLGEAFGALRDARRPSNREGLGGAPAVVAQPLRSIDRVGHGEQQPQVLNSDPGSLMAVSAARLPYAMASVIRRHLAECSRSGRYCAARYARYSKYAALFEVVVTAAAPSGLRFIQTAKSTGIFRSLFGSGGAQITDVRSHAEFSGVLDISNAKHVCISGQRSGRRCGAACRCVSINRPSKIQLQSDVRAVLSRWTAMRLDIHTGEHVGSFCSHSRNACAAGALSHLIVGHVFRLLKTLAFSNSSSPSQKHIRRTEVSRTSCRLSRSACSAATFRTNVGGAIFGRLKTLCFFASNIKDEKHIRRGEVFGTSCSGVLTGGFSSSLSAPDQIGQNFFIFSEFCDTLGFGIVALLDIRKAELSGNSCSEMAVSLGRGRAAYCFAATSFLGVNSTKCLTGINAQKLPDFSKVISRPSSSESITGINLRTSPALCINSGESFTRVNVRHCRLPCEETRLADSSIKAFAAHAADDAAHVAAARRLRRQMHVPVRVQRRESHPGTAAVPRYRLDSMMAVKSESTVNRRSRANTKWGSTDVWLRSTRAPGCTSLCLLRRAPCDCVAPRTQGRAA